MEILKNSVHCCCLLLIFLALTVPLPSSTKGTKIFNVNNYGARGDGRTECSSAFLKAWNAACKYKGRSTMFVPKGVFYINPIVFQGPCRKGSSPIVQIRGILKSPTNLRSFGVDSWLKFDNLNHFTLTGDGVGILDGQGKLSWRNKGCQSTTKCDLNPYLIRFNRITDGTIKYLKLWNGEAYHLNLFRSNNIRIHHLTIASPDSSPNTDGIHISQSSHVNITDSHIGVGDDCVSIGAGNSNILVAKVHCGPGHGISIGSLGKHAYEKDVIGVTVRNCTLSGTTNGLRIKTWQHAKSAPKVSDIMFQDIHLINVANPIYIDQKYCPGNSCSNEPASPISISNVKLYNIHGTSKTKTAVKLKCSSAKPCTGIELVDIDITNINGEGASVSECSNVHGLKHHGIQHPPPCF